MVRPRRILLTAAALGPLSLFSRTPYAHPRGSKGNTRFVRASWYGKKFHGRTMANGERFDMFDPTIAAHRTLPFGTELRVANPENGAVLTVVIKDRGPYNENRELDLSWAAAERLDYVEKGVTTLAAEIL